VNEDDGALLAAARAGAPAAIETLLDRYQQRVFRFGPQMCGDAEDAKDVLQETLLAAAGGLADFRGASSVPTWLYAIARSFCIKKRRRSKFAPSEEISLDDAAARLPSPQPGPEEIASGAEVKRALAWALAALDPASREVLVLRDIEGLTATEVVEVTSSSVAAVKSRLHRARASLRASLARTLGEATLESGPGCPDVAGALSASLEGDLDPALCAGLERHIETCAICRRTCDSLKRTLAICSSVRSGPVPGPVKESVRVALCAALRDIADPPSSGSARRSGSAPTKSDS
jgi:RNA polymerase sigma-70 factor (ECF subfamily)